MSILIAEIVLKSSHNCTFTLKSTSGSQIHHSNGERAECGHGRARIPHLSPFVDVSELVSNGARLPVATLLASVNGS